MDTLPGRWKKIWTDNDLVTETELLKQRFQKFIRASNQVRWTLQSTNATEDQIEQDYSTVAVE
ncbi:hypothetical protein GHT06_020480 [Daphnia sinensis]|uniref:Uncharacterized protein n=1 Tax=Daphnia sinensis TaxID=1820382 RepID=A0AAD5PP57_9CRUS|nr:hypothetical protein GHT06_020480 [Daphnia sinensis]